MKVRQLDREYIIDSQLDEEICTHPQVDFKCKSKSKLESNAKVITTTLCEQTKKPKFFYVSNSRKSSGLVLLKNNLKNL